MNLINLDTLLNEGTTISDLVSKSQELISDTSKYEPINIPVEEDFSHDCYARTITIPEGACVVGKVHKYENLNFLLKGEMLLIDIEGARHIKAPYKVVSPSGVQRLAYAVTECVWTTVHGTKERDTEKIEKEYVCKDLEEYKKLTFNQVKEIA